MATISSGVYSLVGVLIGAGITTIAQLYLERRRERRTERAEQRALDAAKRQVAAELYESGVAARCIWSGPEWAHDNYLHLLGCSSQWEKHESLLAHDSAYLPVRLAYLFADQAARALEVGGPHHAERNAVEAYDQIRHALEKLDESGQLRLPDSDEGDVDIDDDVSLRVGQTVATEPAIAENGRTT